MWGTANTWATANAWWLIPAAIVMAAAVFAGIWWDMTRTIKTAVREAAYINRLADRTERLREDIYWDYRERYVHLAKGFHEATNGVPAWVVEAGIDLTRTYEGAA